MTAASARGAGAPTAASSLDPKVWAGLQARAALAGLQLYRSLPADGPQRLLLEHRGVIRQVGLDDLEGVVVASAGSWP